MLKYRENDKLAKPYNFRILQVTGAKFPSNVSLVPLNAKIKTTIKNGIQDGGAAILNFTKT